MAGDRIPEATMLELVRSGEARPLLGGFEIVPVWYRDAWWHVPADEADYVPAGAGMAADFDALRGRAERIAAMIAEDLTDAEPR
jgi:hypothetical protein